MRMIASQLCRPIPSLVRRVGTYFKLPCCILEILDRFLCSHLDGLWNMRQVYIAGKNGETADEVIDRDAVSPKRREYHCHTQRINADHGDRWRGVYAQERSAASSWSWSSSDISKSLEKRLIGWSAYPTRSQHALSKPRLQISPFFACRSKIAHSLLKVGPSVRTATVPSRFDIIGARAGRSSLCS